MSKVSEMINFWKNKNHKLTYENDYNRWKREIYQKNFKKWTPEQFINEVAKDPSVRKFFNSRGNVISDEAFSDLKEQIKPNQMIHSEEQELDGYFKNKQSLLDDFSYVDFNLDWFEKYSDEEILNKLMYGQFHPGRGAVNKFSEEVERFRELGEQRAEKYIELKRQEYKWSKASFNDLSENASLRRYFSDVLESANDFDLKHNHYMLLKEALNYPFEPNSKVFDLIKKHRVFDKQLTLEEKLIMNSALLGQMKAKDDYLNLGLFNSDDIEEYSTSNTENILVLSADSERVDEARELLEHNNNVLKVELNAIKVAAENQYVAAFGRPTSDADETEKKAYVKKIVDKIYGRL